MSDDKVLLVTGASSDVGSELIKRVGGNYRKVWAHYHNSDLVIEELKGKLGDILVPIRADFSDEYSTKL